MLIALSVVVIVLGFFMIKSWFMTDSQSEPFEHFSQITNNEQSTVKIKRGEVTYSLFGSGVGDLKGYSSDEWLIEYYDVLMSNYDLYKADHVTDIPSALERYRLH
ncbi:hypothetical protein D3C73_666970 [compost metagenome]